MLSCSRREFLRVGGLTAAATVAAACVPVTTTTEPPAAPVEAPGAAEPAAQPTVKFSEAPTLAARVSEGALPPVDERLPLNPLVAEGLDGIGNYGGAWRLGKNGQADTTARGMIVSRGLVRMSHEMSIINCLADSWSVNPDSTEWTFRLREGLKWSDGQPLTTEDFRFWYEDLIVNTDYTAAVPVQLASTIEGQRVPAEFIASDDYTFTYKFARPNALFIYFGSIITGIGASPAHFLKPFHPDYGDQAEIDQWVAGHEGWDDWTHMMADKDNANITIERPTHEPWINTNVWSDEYVVMERNPYFWEVDTAGNQLPYIENVTFRNFSSGEVYVLWCVNGEIDCQARHAGDFYNYTVLKEGEASGEYFTQVWRHTAVYGIQPNLTTKDARLRPFFQERNVRIAMSLAINRDEVLEMLLDGFGKGVQYGPPGDSPLYYEKLSKAYTEYDPDRANALLDELGYTERDADGYRVWDDGSGEPISWVLLSGDQEANALVLMVTDYLRDIGLKMNYRGADRALRQEMRRANEAHMGQTVMDRNLVPLADPQIWTGRVGIDSDKSWSTAWTAWYLDPTNPIAEEPPEGHWIRDLWAGWEQLQEVSDEAEQREIFWRMLDIWAEEIPCIGIYGEMPRLVVVKNGFKGIHEGYPYDCCTTNYESLIDNATWYWDEPDKHVL